MALNNNDILKKLRVAHKLRNTDIADILKLSGMEVSESRLDALFRNEDHPKFVKCGDQILRNFLDGLIIKLRGPKDGTAKPSTSSKNPASAPKESEGEERAARARIQTRFKRKE